MEEVGGSNPLSSTDHLAWSTTFAMDRLLAGRACWPGPEGLSGGLATGTGDADPATSRAAGGGAGRAADAAARGAAVGRPARAGGQSAGVREGRGADDAEAHQPRRLRKFRRSDSFSALRLIMSTTPSFPNMLLLHEVGAPTTNDQRRSQCAEHAGRAGVREGGDVVAVRYVLGHVEQNEGVKQTQAPEP